MRQKHVFADKWTDFVLDFVNPHTPDPQIEEKNGFLSNPKFPICTPSTMDQPIIVQSALLLVRVFGKNCTGVHFPATPGPLNTTINYKSRLKFS